MTSQAVREDLEGRLEIQNYALARPLSIKSMFWVSKSRSGSSPVDKLDVLGILNDALARPLSMK